MASPVFITCTVDVWTKVATNVSAGMLRREVMGGVKYVQTYRDTGGLVPVAGDLSEGVPLFEESNDAAISAPVASPIDVYLGCRGGDGKVRVDL